MASFKHRSNQLVSIIVVASLLISFLGLVRPTVAANGGSSGQSSSESTSSSQPLWSYQVKPNNYGPTSIGNQAGHYAAPPSIFDAFSGLSQRQGALSGSPLMTILPILLIAAGGLLLLLPMFTMMIASPFGGGGAFGGGYQNYGYPQMGALNKKRSLFDGSTNQRGLIDLIEHVSTTIDELTRKYSGPQPSVGQNNPQQQYQSINKRAKSLNSSPTSPNELIQPQLQPPNHKPAAGDAELATAASSGNHMPA